MDKYFIKYFTLIIFLAILVKWKNTCKYDPSTFPYSRLSESELMVENQRNPYYQVSGKNFTIWKEPKLQDLQFTIVIKSAPENFHKRAITRHQLQDFKSVLSFFFIIGSIEDMKLQKEIDIESAQNGDILQTSIQDGYQNLIYKALVAFQYLYKNRSSKLDWIIVMDDDLQLDVHQLLKASLNWDQNPNSIICNRVYRNFWPIRDPDESLSSKW